MNDLWTIVEEVAKEHEELVITASLRRLAKLVQERAGLEKEPSASHIKYILNEMGYFTQEKRSHKGFVYRHNQAKHE